MFSGTYQVVSEHLILSAPKKNKDAAGTRGRRRNEEEIKMEGGERKSRRNHASCRRRRRRRRSKKLSEQEFQNYVDGKLQSLQKFYVTAKSNSREEERDPKTEDMKPEETQKKGEGAGTHEVGKILLPCEINVSDRVRKEPEEMHATNQTGRLRFVVDVKPQLYFKGCESLRAKIGRFVDGDLHTRPPEHPESPERGIVDGKEGEETKGKSEEELKEVDEGSQATATTTGGEAAAIGGDVTVGEGRLARWLGTASLTLAAARELKVKEARVEMKPKGLDPVSITLGQAQLWVSNSDFFYLKKGVLEVINEWMQQKESFQVAISFPYGEFRVAFRISKVGFIQLQDEAVVTIKCRKNSQDRCMEKLKHCGFEEVFMKRLEKCREGGFKEIFMTTIYYAVNYDYFMRIKVEREKEVSALGFGLDDECWRLYEENLKVVDYVFYLMKEEKKW